MDDPLAVFVDMWLRFEGVTMLVGPFAEEYDASLQAQYTPRDPIAEFIRGEISLRQLRVLGEGLPPTSALIRAKRGHTWGDLEYLAMDLANGIRLMRSEAVGIASGKTPRKPELINPPPEAKTPQSEAEEQQQKRAARQFDRAAAALFGGSDT